MGWRVPEASTTCTAPACLSEAAPEAQLREPEAISVSDLKIRTWHGDTRRAAGHSARAAWRSCLDAGLVEGDSTSYREDAGAIPRSQETVARIVIVRRRRCLGCSPLDAFTVVST